MSKMLSIILLCAFTLTAAPLHASASAAVVSQTTEASSVDELIIETVLTVYETSAQTRTAKSISASKEVTIKNAAGATLATFTLHGTFSYDGSSAACTSASYTKSVLDSTWSFTSASASKSANKAVGSYKLSCSANGQTVSNTVTITCAADGTVS